MVYRNFLLWHLQFCCDMVTLAVFCIKRYSRTIFHTFRVFLLWFCRTVDELAYACNKTIPDAFYTRAEILLLLYGEKLSILRVYAFINYF